MRLKNLNKEGYIKLHGLKYPVILRSWRDFVSYEPPDYPVKRVITYHITLSVETEKIDSRLFELRLHPDEANLRIASLIPKNAKWLLSKIDENNGSTILHFYTVEETGIYEDDE